MHKALSLIPRSIKNKKGKKKKRKYTRRKKEKE
jgi:hypothetical protein